MILKIKGLLNLPILSPCLSVMDFPDDSDGKESACNAGDPGSVPASGRSPREGNTHSSILTPVFLSVESHGQRSLVGYSPWGRTESDMTEAT